MSDEATQTVKVYGVLTDGKIRRLIEDAKRKVLAQIPGPRG
jgi:hypothetical protein